VRAPRPCGRALTRHAPRPLPPSRRDASAATVIMRSRDTGSGVCPSRHGRRETRHGVLHVAGANQWVDVCRLSPRACRGLRAILGGDPSARTAALALGASSDLGDGSVAQPSMRCTQWPSRRRARSPSTATSCSEMTFPRMLPTGPRGGASTASLRSCAHETRAPASASLEARRERRDRVIMRSRDTGSGVCAVAPWQTRDSPRCLHVAGANHWVDVCRLSPRACRVLRAILEETCSPAALAPSASSDLGDGSVTQRSMQCTEWSSRRRARSPSTARA
jgi:hypothetical protein